MKKTLAIVLALMLCLGTVTAAAAEDWKIALITMDSIDQHWVTLNEGAQAKAAELGVTVTFMSPNTKDDAQQIECVNNAVAGGYNAIMVAANGPDAISSALREAKEAGIKVVYVDSPANVEAEATFSTDNKAAGKTAGEEMIKALQAAGVTEGSIGIVNVNAATDSTVQREAGFREAFEGTAYTLLETQYGEGDAAKSQSIAENYITQGVVGIFGCNEGSTTGTGNAIKASGTAVVGVGFDKSDAILGLIQDGYLLATMAQNPDVMGSMGVEACVKVLNGESLGGALHTFTEPGLLSGSPDPSDFAALFPSRKAPCRGTMEIPRLGAGLHTGGLRSAASASDPGAGHRTHASYGELVPAAAAGGAGRRDPSVDRRGSRRHRRRTETGQAGGKLQWRAQRPGEGPLAQGLNEGADRRIFPYMAQAPAKISAYLPERHVS